MHSSSRETDVGQATSGSYTRDPDVWFPDGNVVVLADSTAYRVHSGLLSRHSTVLNDLFNVPQPPQHEELVDGCPIVRVSDSAEEFKHLLRMIYDGFNYIQPDVLVDFSILAALARLGHKYQLDGVVAEALRRLRPAYPNSFDAWDAGQQSVRFSSNPRENITAIDLFRLLDRKDMLPTAIYISSLFSHRDVLMSTLPSSDSTERLSLEDAENVLKVQYQLLSADAEMKVSWFNTLPSEDCTQQNSCDVDIPMTHRTICQSLGKLLDGDPLNGAPFARMTAKIRSTDGLCEACIDMLSSRALALRKELWKRLPDITGVDLDPGTWIT